MAKYLLQSVPVTNPLLLMNCKDKVMAENTNLFQCFHAMLTQENCVLSLLIELHLYRKNWAAIQKNPTVWTDTLGNSVFTVISVISLAVWVCRLMVNPLPLGVNKNGHRNEIYTKGTGHTQICLFRLLLVFSSQESLIEMGFVPEDLFSHILEVSHMAHTILCFFKNSKVPTIVLCSIQRESKILCHFPVWLYLIHISTHMPWLWDTVYSLWWLQS